MSLQSGLRLGQYEVVAKLGEGGMGEVYRARDSRLNRDVALKVLPAVFTADADRLARFEREAQALAALNHPHIAQIYGLEHNAIVMELVEGQTLDEMIRLALHNPKGPTTVADALPIARQIALALEAAHDAGIVHRDLKPGNIKVRPDGAVKVLDFGLAKAMGSAGSEDPASVASRLAASPTLTARATEAGLILGTAAYMAPEQAKGRPVDRRADVWAFGVVLYEMLAGRRAFGGDDVTEVLAAVIRDTPSFDALPAETPPAIRRLLRRCLEKDPRKRLRDMGDAGLEIEAAIAGESADEPRPIAVAPIVAARRPAWLVAGAAIGLAALAAAAAWLLKPAPPVDRSLAKFAVTLPDGHQFINYTTANLAISRDGRRLAYRTPAGIFVRDLDATEPRFIVKVPGSGVWLSPDGRTLLFATPAGLARAPADGGPSQDLAQTAGILGADWGDDDRIVFSAGASILRVAAAGGAVETLVDLESPSDIVAWPQSLDAGRYVMYTKTTGGMTKASTVIRSLSDRSEQVLMPGVGAVRYLDTGHLVYGQEDRLLAVPFDLVTRTVRGTAVPLPERVYVSAQSGWAQAAFARNGTLVYLPPGGVRALSRLVWTGPDGKGAPVATAERVFSDLALSPDGRRAAVHLWDEDNDVWVADLVRGGLTRITYTPSEEETPVWSPNGTELAYAATRPGLPRTLFRRGADGSAAAVEHKVFEDGDHFHVNDWSPDGKTIILEVRRPGTSNDLIAVDVASGTHKNLLASAFSESQARLSRDGRWLAYTSTESGRNEVYVQPYPNLDRRVPVSTEGGSEPIWSRDRKQLFFRSPKGVMAVTITSTSPLDFSAPRQVFEDRYRRTQGDFHTHFDVAPDGRFLMIEDPGFGANRQREEINVVLNWFETLKRLAPRQ